MTLDGKEYALITAFCFGLNPVTLKLGFSRQGRTEVALWIGLGVAVIIYALLLPFAGGLHWDEVTTAALIGFVAGGLLGSGIGRNWMFIAIDKLGAAPATAIKNSAPVISTMLAVLLLGETVDAVQVAAIIAIVAGITLVTWRKGQGIKQLAGIGVLAAVGSAIAYGIRPLFLEFGLDKANIPLTSALIGAVAALLYASLIARGQLLRLRFSARDASLWFFLLSGVLQAVGFLCLNLGLAAQDVTVVYPVTSSAPIFTLGFTALLLRGHEQVTLRLAAGVVLVVLGVIFL
jgi:drug/metabolite transporter (DMT)-like permease